ncbi:TIGR03089 family protein [Mycobacterium sp. ITM-2016-00317]|uniref:TIGR03089 family protein n=1 Tax=Mycobacterium sp. ITM-2016-00317 TaxID=2099694 RepID=UPI000D4D9650|nr:TIGR03089 family protein [Mycobacterium sp. ITM-2016-00317]WNG88985.1 TIGR03089 family protein [Mycobacterium sp. ITM-2016-00317]
MPNLSSAILDPLMAANPAGPRITYYDDATGERIELSTATLANWAAKTGNLLRDELGATPGTRVAVLLPAHWQTVAVLFGIWWIGAEAVFGGAPDEPADIALCTADRIDDADAAVGTGEIAVLSLDPFGKPVPDLPVGLTDYATAVRVHGDQIVPERQPGAALNGRSADDVLAAARASATAAGVTGSDRVLSAARWETADDVIEQLLALYAVGASLVLVANPDATQVERRRQSEKLTRSSL